MIFAGTNYSWKTDSEETFARGGNSLLYKVTGDGLSAGIFALKAYNCSISDAERHSRFLDEIEIVKNISRIDGCVKYIDHGFGIDRNPFYVMPLYSGGTFRTKYINGNGNSDSILEILTEFQKMLQIVSSLHKEGLAVRDIKPQNILFDENHDPVISDFGLSLWIDVSDEERRTPPNGIVGSQGYRAPEWATRYPEPNQLPGDIWSLGRTLWALVSGHNPPDNYETLGAKGSHLNIYVERRYANILQSIVTMCTSQKPEDRPSISDLISHVAKIKNEIMRIQSDAVPEKLKLAERLATFSLQLKNSEIYIDSQRLESEVNIKVSEIEECANSIKDFLEKSIPVISKGIPQELGTFNIISHMPVITAFIQRELTIRISDNRAWSRRIAIMFVPSKTLESHKSMQYVCLSFSMGLTEHKTFYWLVQLRDQTKIKEYVVEQIETRSLASLVAQKIHHLEDIISDHFINAIEKHFKG